MKTEGQGKPALLIVDDTPTNLDILVDFFAESGFEVYVGRERGTCSQADHKGHSRHHPAGCDDARNRWI